MPGMLTIAGNASGRSTMAVGVESGEPRAGIRAHGKRKLLSYGGRLTHELSSKQCPGGRKSSQSSPSTVLGADLYLSSPGEAISGCTGRLRSLDTG